MKRSIVVGTTLGLLAAAAVPLAFRVSPWPGALLVKRLFKHGGAQTTALLQKHEPRGVETIDDIPYGSSPDERLDLYRPSEATGALPVLVWVHGGGWVGGNRKTIATWLKLVASRGYACVAIGYSTARPSARYPTPVRQVSKALDFLHSHAYKLGLDVDHLVLGGSSAGAQIASQVAMLGSGCYARRMGLLPSVLVPKLRGMVLASGAFDIAGVGDNWFVNSLLWAYTGNRHFRRDPHLQLMAITPNLTTRFPPSFVTSGNGDPLVGQAHALVARMQKLGIDVDALLFSDDHQPSLLHEYQFDLDNDQGRLAMDRMIAFLDRVTASHQNVTGMPLRAVG